MDRLQKEKEFQEKLAQHKQSLAALKKLAEYFEGWGVEVSNNEIGSDEYMVTFHGLSGGEVRMLLEAAKNCSGHEAKPEPARR